MLRRKKSKRKILLSRKFASNDKYVNLFKSVMNFLYLFKKLSKILARYFPVIYRSLSDFKRFLMIHVIR